MSADRVYGFLRQARRLVCYVFLVLTLVTCSTRRLYLSFEAPFIRRYVCPAYESAFVLSDTLHQLMFTPIGLDSMPLPPPEVKKDENRLIARVSERKKLRQMNNLAPVKQPPPPKKPRDKEKEVEDVPEAAPLDFFDSLLVDTAPLPVPADSVGFGTPPAEDAEPDVVYRYGYRPDDDFDVDQTFYNEQFGDLLIIEKEEEVVADSAGIQTYEDQFEDIPSEYGADPLDAEPLDEDPLDEEQASPDDTEEDEE